MKVRFQRIFSSCIEVHVLVLSDEVILLGNVSWKDFGGSWLIRAMTETLYKHAHHAHLQELFEHVSTIDVFLYKVNNS